MRSNPTVCEMRTPRALSDVLQILADEPGVWRPFAGGTDLMVLLEAGKLAHRQFLSLLHLNELRGIADHPDFVEIGALSSFSEIRQSPVVQRHFPLLCEAAAQIGAVAIQNRATIGGNIMNASPAGDSLPALLVYDAEVELVSKTGARWVRYTEFHTGYKKMIARPDEVLTRLRLPKTDPWSRRYFRKVAARAAQAITKVSMVGLVRMAGDKISECRLAVGSAAPVPLRCVKTEATLRGQVVTPAVIRQAQQALLSEIAPIDDIRSTAAYRRRVALNLLEEFLT